MDDVTQTLSEVAKGNREAANRLFQLVYDELRHLAAVRLAREPSAQTLNPTALVHEVWLRLVASDAPREWNSASHFVAVAAEVMRHILVDNARRKRRLKRGGDRQRVHVELESIVAGIDDSQLLDLDAGIEELAAIDPVKARLVVLRYFGGMTTEQACEVLNISRTTAHRHWTYARAWLYRRLTGSGQ
jgi:RNA polymerase sigma factor (TIGR02999 family)